MHFLAEPEEDYTAKSVAEYIDCFSGMTLQTKRELVLEWLKVSALMESLDPRNKLTYMLPGFPLARRRRDNHNLQECDRKPAKNRKENSTRDQCFKTGWKEGKNRDRFE